MRARHLFPLLFLVSLALAEPFITLWSLNIQAKGGNTNGREFLIWGESEIYKIDTLGQILWKRSFRNLERAFLLPDGQSIAITKEGRLHKLHLIDPKGYVFWGFTSNQVVSIAGRDKKVAMITDKGELYIFTLRSSPGRLKGWRRYNFHKPLKALAILTDGRLVLAMPDRMCIFQEGKQPLFFPYPNIEKIIPLSDGGFLSLIPQAGEFFLSRHTSYGYVAWSKQFKGEASSLLSLSPFYSLCIEQNVGGDMEERKLVVLEQDGSIRWQRGGLLFKPLPLLLTSDGAVLCTDETGGKLLLFNQKGRYIWEKKCDSKINRSIPFYPSSALLLYENHIEFIEVRVNG